MADLKNIMNVEDDHQDSRQIQDDRSSAPRPPRDPRESSAFPSSSRHATHANLSPTPPYALEPRLSPSSRPSHLFAANISSPSSPAPASSSADPSRRRSNTSTDSMDSPYAPGHGYAGFSAPSGSHMRPYPPSSSSGDVPVKLTPVTGRVSRAKKGAPVHVCDLCQPPKTFTRAEHLRRHQLSHGAAGLTCTVPGCDRSFYRKDLLERHQQRHEQDREAGRSGDSIHGRQGPYGSRSPGSPSYGYPAPSPVPGMSAVFSNASPNSGSASGKSASGMPMETSHWPSVGNPPGRDDSGVHRMRGTSENFSMGGTSDAVGHWGLSAPSSGMGASYHQPRTLPELLAPVSQMPLPGRASSDSSNRSTPSSNSQHAPTHTSGSDWGSIPTYSTVSREMQDSLMSGGHFAMGLAYPASSAQLYPPTYAEGLGIPLGYDDAGLYGSHHNPETTVRSLSPHAAVVQSSETLVTTSSALPAGRMILPQACGRQPGEALGLLTAQDGMPVSLSLATRGAIPAYLDIYWGQVHPVHPIIHRPTFEGASEVAPGHVDVLRCAMAAVATQFLPAREHRIAGHQLHAYARQGLKLLPQPEDWDLPTMQAVLLCEYYARFRGRMTEDYKPSLLFSMLYQLVVNNQATLAPISTSSNASMGWATWVDAEARRRLLAACFLLDVHSMLYHEQPGVSFTGLDYSSPNTLPIPLTVSTTELWEARTPHAWTAGLRDKRALGSLNSTSLAALTPADIAAVPPFDASILLAAHALQLPRRQSLTDVDLAQDASAMDTTSMHMANLFSESAAANAYLALHHTPLHTLLSVSGDSWVFNTKVPAADSFSGHQGQLERWRRSGTAAAATVFAARALRAFLGIDPSSDSDADTAVAPPSREISDYWGLYVCALICWAFSHGGSGRRGEGSNAAVAVRWIRDTARTEPGALQSSDPEQRWGSQGVVGVAREVLARDCLGGQNRMFADAVRVLRKLEEGDVWEQL